MRNRPIFVPLVKILFLIVISMFAVVSIFGYVRFHDFMIAGPGLLTVVILIVLGIWAWGNDDSKSDNEIQRVDTEVVIVADRIKIPKEDYLQFITMFGDNMASPDPERRQLAARAYTVFKSSFKSF